MMIVREVPLSQLAVAEWNANRVPAGLLAKLRRSIVEFGVVENLVARPHPDRPGVLEVISGNHRLELYRELGMESAPVVVVDVDDARARLLAQVLNRTRGTDDPVAKRELLERVLASLSVVEVLGLLPEPERDLDSILASLELGGVDPDELPEPAGDTPESRAGEVYELGAHRLACGDATDERLWRALLAGERGQLLVTDPPYGVGYGEKTRRLARARRGPERADIAGDGGSLPELGELLRGSLGLTVGALEPGCAGYVFHSDATGPTFRLALERAGFGVHQTLVWVKNHHVLGGQDYQPMHEPILYGWRPGRGHTWHGGRSEATVLLADRPRAAELHPTMKPVGLLRRLICNSSQSGELVLDPFAGSGSTLIAAELTGRRCLAIELDPRYCDLIRQRYASLAAGE